MFDLVWQPITAPHSLFDLDQHRNALPTDEHATEAADLEAEDVLQVAVRLQTQL
jgi:hypothetical protein